MARIGILGGTFDPIHNGHLELGRQALKEYHLHQIWFMPSRQPPHKRKRRISDSSIRCDMITLAIKDEPAFVLSDFELTGTGYTYTADTLQALKQHYPEHQFYFIIGADSLYQIEEWYHPELILSSVTILAAGRKYDSAGCTIQEQIDYLNRKYSGKINQLYSPEIDISSSRIRDLAAQNSDIAHYVPKTVYDYITGHHLYKVKSNEQTDYDIP